jgi:hypothetical protein
MRNAAQIFEGRLIRGVLRSIHGNKSLTGHSKMTPIGNPEIGVVRVFEAFIVILNFLRTFLDFASLARLAD